MCASVFFKFLVQINLICFLALAQNMVGDKCALMSGREAECKLLRDCAKAVRQITRYRNHNLARCGFQYSQEIVCCPFENTPRPIVYPGATSPLPTQALNPVRQSPQWAFSPRTASSSFSTQSGLELTETNSIVPKSNSGDRRNFKEAPKTILDDEVTFRTNAVVKPKLNRADIECQKIVARFTPPIDTRIIGGIETDIQSFPHMVAVGYRQQGSPKIHFLCGGSLVSELFVLTAAHCIPKWVGASRNTRLALVRTGDKVAKDSFMNETTDTRIAKAIVHPGYKHPQKDHDIALIKLRQAIKFGDTRHPACLFTGSSDPETDLIATGWGVFDKKEDKQSEVLRKTTLALYSREYCNRLLSSSQGRMTLHNGQLCALGNHTDTCTGDSGGPIQVSMAPDRHYRLVGITSFGFGCDQGKPGIYTRVAYYRGWIEKHVWPYPSLESRF